MTQDPIGFDGGDWNLYRYVSNVPNSLVDASGKRPRPGLPCPPEVIAARKMVCDALRNATLASLKGCVTGPKHLQCLKDWCNKGRIYCVKATINECVGGCGFSYGGGDPGGRQDPDETVYICLPRGSRCNRRICKNGLAQTILHEINGNCGVNHNPTGPWEDACSGSAACQCPKLGI